VKQESRLEGELRPNDTERWVTTLRILVMPAKWCHRKSVDPNPGWRFLCALFRFDVCSFAAPQKAKAFCQNCLQELCYAVQQALFAMKEVFLTVCLASLRLSTSSYGGGRHG
jgi:hypothetical protein